MKTRNCNCSVLRKIGLVAVMSLVAIWSVPAEAQSGGKPKSDPRVGAALKEAGLKFAETSLGNYKVTFELDDGRGHWVFISSRTEKFGDMETRRIWATVYKTKDLLSQKLANSLLMDNVPQKLGAYELTKDDGGYKVVYAAKVDANCSAASLRDTLRLVLIVADTKEKELSDKDTF